MMNIKNTVTETQNPLGFKKESRLLVEFAIPCVISMLVTALYNIVDQIFIGQGVGMLGNAATNIAFPFSTTCTAISLLLGIGSATNVSLKLGAGRETKEQDVNHAVGLELACKRGDKVNKGDTICIVYHDEELKPQWVEELYHAFELTNEEVAPQPIIEKVLS